VKCGIYIRISDKDEKSILENQRLRGIEDAKNSNLEVYKIYEDVASGGEEDRPGLNELRHDARSRKFGIVIFTHPSRMTRQGYEGAMYILRELESRGIGWHFTDMPILNYDANTPKLAKDIILGVITAIDEDYRRNISEKTKAALARRKALGIQLGRHRKDCQCPKHRKNATPKVSDDRTQD